MTEDQFYRIRWVLFYIFCIMSLITLRPNNLTFSIVHGVLTGVYQSFPDIGCQGANLTLEVVFRGLSHSALTFLFISLTLAFIRSK